MKTLMALLLILFLAFVPLSAYVGLAIGVDASHAAQDTLIVVKDSVTGNNTWGGYGGPNYTDGVFADSVATAMAAKITSLLGSGTGTEDFLTIDGLGKVSIGLSAATPLPKKLDVTLKSRYAPPMGNTYFKAYNTSGALAAALEFPDSNATPIKDAITTAIGGTNPNFTSAPSVEGRLFKVQLSGGDTYIKLYNGATLLWDSTFPDAQATIIRDQIAQAIAGVAPDTINAELFAKDPLTFVSGEKVRFIFSSRSSTGGAWTANYDKRFSDATAGLIRDSIDLAAQGVDSQ